MKRYRAVVVLAVLVAGLAGLAAPVAARRGVRVGEVAPEVTGSPWINSEPLSLARLRGQVVLVEFWTFG